MPRLQVSLLTPTCALHMAYLLKRHLCDPGYVQLSQSRLHSLLLVPSMWEHIMRAQILPAREVLVLPWPEPTILSIQILVQGLALFLNHEPSFFLWSTLVNPNLMGTVVLIQPTVISCIINFVCPSFNGIQARRAVILEGASDHVSHISEQLLVCPDNTDLAILLGLHKPRYVEYDLAHRSKSPATSIFVWIADCYFLLSTRSQCCG